MKNLNKYLTQGEVTGESELMPKLSPRKSFYNKARVAHMSNGAYILLSYGDVCAMIDPSGEFYINGKYSATTTTHQRDFAYQYAGLEVSSKKLLKYRGEFMQTLNAALV